MLPLLLALFIALQPGPSGAQQGVSIPPAPPQAPVDTSAFATKSDLASSLAAGQTKQSTIPATGPGAGLCRLTVVPSDMVTSGGMTGQAGTCSRIVQCGTSANFVVTQFNIGAGC